MTERQNLKGIIHGHTIELAGDAGLPDGQPVNVTVEPTDVEAPLSPGEGILRSAGAWAEDADDLERFLEWNRLQRSQHGSEIDE